MKALLILFDESRMSKSVLETGQAIAVCRRPRNLFLFRKTRAPFVYRVDLTAS
jgi:hypothetical protein